MKLITHFSILTLLLTVAVGSVSAQERWTGRYEFEELAGKTSAGTTIVINHEIEITDSDDGLIALIRSNGFQTSRDLVGNARIDGGKLSIFFLSYGADNILEPYDEGDLLLTLDRRKDELLTFWGKFRPVVEKNEKTGKVYFQKVRTVEE